MHPLYAQCLVFGEDDNIPKNFFCDDLKVRIDLELHT